MILVVRQNRPNNLWVPIEAKIIVSCLTSDVVKVRVKATKFR